VKAGGGPGAQPCDGMVMAGSMSVSVSPIKRVESLNEAIDARVARFAGLDNRPPAPIAARRPSVITECPKPPGAGAVWSDLLPAHRHCASWATTGIDRLPVGASRRPQTCGEACRVGSTGSVDVRQMCREGLPSLSATSSTL
jgi:hypothetical protein